MVSDGRRTPATDDALDEFVTNDESDDEFLDSIELTENVFENEEPLNVFDAPNDEETQRIIMNEPPIHIPIFKWKKTAPPFRPNVFPFDDTDAGVQKEEFEFDDTSTALSFFEALVTPNLIGKIAFETNRYYKQTVENGKRPEKWREWFDTHTNEMYTFIAVTLLMARNGRPRIAENWSSDPLLSSPVYSAIMSKDRYMQILNTMHFCDNGVQTSGDRLFKIKMVLKEIRKNFRDAMRPYENVVVDETLCLCKGQSDFRRRYVESKRRRFGMKLFVICDVQTDYVLDFVVYAGTATRLCPYSPNVGICGGVVKTLMKPYLNKGHTLFTEHQYTSPILAKHLLRHKTNTIGTVRKNRRGMPNLKKKLKFGEFESSHTKRILALKWSERGDEEVYVLSTCTKARLIDVEQRDRNSSKPPVQKPECIVRFNNCMRSTDKSDVLFRSSHTLNTRMKWYKKLFFHLIDLSVLNAHSLYKTTTGNRTTPLADFQLELVRELLQKYSKIQTSKQVRRSKELPPRIKAPHYPSECPPTPSGIRGRKRCVVCTAKSKNQTSYYQCKECDNIGLCVAPCFGIYHTKINYTPK